MSGPSAGPTERLFDTGFSSVHTAQKSPDVGKDASLTPQSKMDVITTKDLAVEETPLQATDGQPFEIFSGSSERAQSSEDTKERLPSIVVESTDYSPLENGEHFWPPDGTASMEGEEDIFHELNTSPSHLTGEREEQEGSENDEGSPKKRGVQRCQSYPLARAQLPCSRLTLPAVSLCPEEMPSCLRNCTFGGTPRQHQKIPSFLLSLPPSHDL